MAEPPYQLDDDEKEKINKKSNRRTYSEDEVQELINIRSKEAAREAALEVLRDREKEKEKERDSDFGLDPEIVKKLQTTVGVFNALKEFASNPIQKAIETEVGTLSADVVRQAFKRPSGEGGKKDLVEVFLNSQFAYGLGNGIGQRAPELVETMDRTFGKKKTEQFFDSIIGRSGGQGRLQGLGQVIGSGQREQISGRQDGAGSGAGSGVKSGTSGIEEKSYSSPPGSKNRKDAERELILSLDPNNAEHVAAYADSQGGMSVAVAQKMLKIQQDDFINQLELENVAIQKEIDKDVVKSTPYAETAVSFKDIQKKETQKQTTKKMGRKETEVKEEGDIVEIPDTWKEEDLTQEEFESIEKMRAEERNKRLAKKEVPTVAVPPPEIEQKSETNIEIIASEDVVKEIKEEAKEEIKKNDDTPIRAMCYKCRRIKEVEEIKVGSEIKRICASCKEKE